jgi:hypothetical protein
MMNVIDNHTNVLTKNELNYNQEKHLYRKTVYED